MDKKTKMEERNCYMVSGLGADKRAFGKLELPKNWLAVHVEWLKPNRNESISEYAQRLILKYDMQSNCLLIGLSFGGLIAVEISKQIEAKQVILISSASKRTDLPSLFQLANKLALTRLIPVSTTNLLAPLIAKFFGPATQQSRQQLVEIIKDTDPDFARWAIQTLTSWSEQTAQANAIRIHGDRDWVIPLKNRVDYPIKDGGHFMVSDRAKEISRILSDIASKN